ncbi:lipid droplet-associated protein [Allokutzneria sp. A3M-2-11 16]|uniref:lipid droplet-associated protein n=1 Tax=Allokutzneria sp. A3M-2-11 16 TaxID=2962043 RepID=UPI0020B76A63|nr:lipid droplet-associated protein [Allokutzneria sp. A3M-2-11 16]MCP3798664.1 lipid droplet-associated protein [Allokutzneria sp. A3M-2-11 16]
MKSLPLPLRVAAGLAVTAVEQARKLPQSLAGLPVTVASVAMQASMRAQQHLTELAIKGDEALATFRTAEEAPEWATFDEDVDLSEPAAEAKAEEQPEPEEDGGPEALPGYDDLTFAQLRGRLKSLTAEQLEEVLAHERARADREAFVRMLTNRLTTVRGS